MEITLDRAREAIEYKKEQNMEMLLNSVVQGSTFLDLRRECARELSKLDADLYPIGAVVPLMESYHYKDLVDVVMNTMKELSDTLPIICWNHYVTTELSASEWTATLLLFLVGNRRINSGKTAEKV